MRPVTDMRQNSTLDAMGYQLWQELDIVIILEESMRHKQDVEYSELLGRVRQGGTKEGDLKPLNSRVVGCELQKQLQDCCSGQVPFVVRTNELRQALNWKAIGKSSELNGVMPIVCVARVTTQGHGRLSNKDLNIWLRTDETETSNLPVLLPLLAGMPVRITQNFAVEIGISNGTDGELCGVCFPSNTTFDPATFSGSIASWRASCPLSHTFAPKYSTEL